MTDAFTNAVSGDPTGTLTVRPLPDRVISLLHDVGAPPRLAAHLRLVHDVSCSLVDWLRSEFPNAPTDRELITFGSATHDIGKVLYPAEIVGPGSEHEAAGRLLLIERGTPEHLARFAGTHASWSSPNTTFEDHLVSLSDKIWKGRRQEDLESLIVRELVASEGGQPWSVFLRLDDKLAAVAADADDRLRFQSQFAPL